MALSPKLKAGQPKYESLHQNTSNTSKVKMTLRLITLCKVYQLTLLQKLQEQKSVSPTLNSQEASYFRISLASTSASQWILTRKDL